MVSSIGSLPVAAVIGVANVQGELSSQGQDWSLMPLGLIGGADLAAARSQPASGR